MMSGIRNSPPISISSPRETTPVALSTGRREKTPARRARSTTRAASVSGSAGAPRPSSTRFRSASRSWRTSAVRRARGTALSSGRSARRRRSWSTDGKPRRAVARSALIERGLDLLSQAGDDLLGLVAPRLGRPFAIAGLPAAAHGVLDEPRPQLVEVGARQALAPQRPRPLLGEAVDEPIALGGETPRLPDEVGQARGHPPTP